jgi:hypothetical protein
LIDEKVRNLGTVVNGWSFNLDTGNYGTDYFLHAAITKTGLGSNILREAVPSVTYTDSQGKPLFGANNYTIHFGPGQIPPVRAFWSITMYNNKSLFVDIRLNTLKFPTFIDGVILLASIYSVTIATALFIMPAIFHQRHYQMFDVEKFLSRSKKFLLGGASLLMLTMYLTLGLALHSTVSNYLAFTLAALPFIFIAAAWRINVKS